MIRTKLWSALIAAVVLACLWPVPAHADSTQQNKNTWRNLAIGSAGLAGVGLLNHNSTEAIVGAAGTAYSASRYEHLRHGQSRARTRWRRRHYHHH